jgi:hypothetical protein
MQAKPPLAALAEVNVAHWQSASDQRNILTIARVPILFGAGFTDDSTIEVGASSMIRTSDVNAKLSFVEHTGAAIGAGQTDLDRLELQMQSLGLQILVPQPGSKTATGEIRDNVRENSSLAAMARGLQDGLEQAFGFMAQFLNVAVDGDKAGGSLIVNQDFGTSGIGDVQYLTAAVIAGKLDDATYLDELRRRGVLSDSVSTEAVLHRIASRRPELDGRPMLLEDHSHNSEH